MKATGLVLSDRAYRTLVTPPDAFEDESRFGNDGVHTDITWVRLPSGLWVRRFDGSTSLVTVNGVASNGFFDRAFSVVGWGRLSDWSHHSFLFSAGIAATELEDTNIYYNYSWRKFVADSYIDAVGTNEVTSAGTYLNNTEWHFLGAAWDADGHVNRFILDGVDEGSDSTFNNDLSGFDRCLIGQYEYTAPTGSVWEGDIALPRIYNYALTAAQIYKHFQAERAFFGV